MEAAWERGRTRPSSNMERAQAGFFSVLLRDSFTLTASPSSPTPACLGTRGGFGVLPKASEQKADEGGGTDASAKSLLILCSRPARGVEGERRQRAEPGDQIAEPRGGVSAPRHCCWAVEWLQGPGQGWGGTRRAGREETEGMQESGGKPTATTDPALLTLPGAVVREGAASACAVVTLGSWLIPL